MKTAFLIFIMLFGSLFGQSGLAKFPVLKGPYFGQTPPGNTPVPFAPDMIGKRFKRTRSITFSPDGTEAYWGVIVFENNDWKRWIVESKMVEGTWTEPKLAFFSKYDLEDDVPCLSPDGRRLFFISRRPIHPNEGLGKENIWVIERQDQGWGEPRPLPPGVNGLPQIHHQLSLDRHGTLFFAAAGENCLGEIDMYCSKWVEGTYQNPEHLGPAINGPQAEYTPWIARDGSYLLFCRNRPEGSEGALWISFKRKDNRWSDPEELSKYVKMPQRVDTFCPSVVDDGKYLIFYCSDGETTAPYWADASFIEVLRKDALNGE